SGGGSTMPDLLRFVWDRADTPGPFYTDDELARWPSGVAEQLQEAGLLRQTTNVTSVVCDACGEGHVEEVVTVESPPGTGLRGYICCPEAGRLSVPLNRLKRWEVDFSRLAECTASALAMAGDVEEVIPARVWLLGKTTLAGQSHEVFLARGLAWQDGAEVVSKARRLLASPRPIVLFAGSVPSTNVWSGDPPASLTLSAILSWNRRRLVADRALLEGTISRGRRAKAPAPSASFPTPTGASWEDVCIVMTDHGLRIDV